MYVIETDEMSNMASKIQSCKSKTIPFKGTLKVHQVTQMHEMSKPIILTMKSMSCFCCRDIENLGQQFRECPHYFLGKIKYNSRRTLQDVLSCQDTEEISCEPLILENISHGPMDPFNVQKTNPVPTKKVKTSNKGRKAKNSLSEFVQKQREKNARAQKSPQAGTSDQSKFGEEVSEDYACIVCQELYTQSKPGEHWVQCLFCNLWSHNECAGVDKKAQYICDFCK